MLELQDQLYTGDGDLVLLLLWTVFQHKAAGCFQIDEAHSLSLLAFVFVQIFAEIQSSMQMSTSPGTWHCQKNSLQLYNALFQGYSEIRLVRIKRILFYLDFVTLYMSHMATVQDARMQDQN